MEKQFFKKYFLDYWFGFFAWIVLALLIFLLIPNALLVLLVIAIWSFMWVIPYADYVAKTAVESYIERIRKETYPTTKDLNEDTDLILELDNGMKIRKNYY
ncbi:MAG TPA: hypothetical protein DDY21_02030 [Candidatus Moranbacteria bacterium]|nr:hypothetical protein [Candidatus Moranbacteria bacterium]HCO99822.1 hypothetical protein [Candidatus Moranbacteria bacterium]